MIDDSPETIDKQERTDALANLIIEEDLRYGTVYSGRPRYYHSTLQDYTIQLAQQLKDEITPTKPQYEIIWQKGSKVLKPAYLKKIGFKAYLKTKEAADDERIEEEEEEDDAHDSEVDSAHASAQEKHDKPKTAQQVPTKTAEKVPAKTVRPLKCRSVKFGQCYVPY